MLVSLSAVVSTGSLLVVIVSLWFFLPILIHHSTRAIHPLIKATDIQTKPRTIYFIIYHINTRVYHIRQNGITKHAHKQPPKPFPTLFAETVVFLYIFPFIALAGFLMKPIPFFPYSGFTTRFSFRFTLPVVLADIDFLIDGFLIPIFIIFPPCTRQ